MAETGRLVIRTYASNMLIPISNSKITVSGNENGEKVLIAFRTTDEDGKTDEIIIDAPDITLSKDRNNTVQPFSTVNIKVEKDDYDISIINDVQIFSDRLSEQNIEMVPLPENADFNEFYNVYNVTPQNL